MIETYKVYLKKDNIQLDFQFFTRNLSDKVESLLKEKFPTAEVWQQHDFICETIDDKYYQSAMIFLDRQLNGNENTYWETDEERAKLYSDIYNLER